jgi:DNA-binding NarL/FixJ family response regulator
MLAAALAPAARCPLPRPIARGHLRLVPDAAIVDSPALLAHADVAGLLAPRMIVIGGCDDDVERSVAMLVAGAEALLPTDVTAPELREAVRCVLRGEAVVPPAVAAAVAERVRAAEARPQAVGQKPPAPGVTG